MGKKIRITEDDLHKIVNETIKQLFHESSDENKGKNNLSVKQFLDSLTREELEALLINYNDIVHVASYSNPLTIQMGKKLQEGLIRTYPIDKTISYVKSYFKLNDDQIQKAQGENGVSHIVVFIPMIGNNTVQVQRAMSLCGYYLGYNTEVETEYGKWLQMQFEAKVQEDASKQIRQEETKLLHLTPLYNLSKIQKIGFSPRCKNELFNYPSRVYFLRGSMKEEDVINIGHQLCDYNSSIGNTGEYVLFTVDLTKIPHNVKLFLDPNYPYGIYTDSNISSNVIIQYEKIML